MKFILLLASILTIVNDVWCAVAIIPADTSKNHSGYCYSAYTGPIEAAGEIKNIEGKCVQAICNDDRSIRLESCGAVSGPCGKTDVDYSKPYPQCCPKPKGC
ncbi:uncharacterized protein LOC132704473 isoform X2 [Cylas formicarius]|uniref:uncharacterized protein LOC132704473 isoform X2 n=1 Tax=Cylas formicarius TaxID=197179 RepID=UPI002958AD32|nr:uncharacterized protein LOC132704473 isoform X2 [Cylas formicarius]